MKIGFKRHTTGNLVYYTIPSFDNTGVVKHCFTTRLGGVSTGETSSLNLGFNKNDMHENVLENYSIIGGALGIDPQKLVFSNQVHKDVVRIITSADCGKGITRQNDIVGVDALVCGESGVPFITFYADCVPLFFLDPEKKVTALTHSGWRSTVKNIAANTVAEMSNEFGCKPSDLLVGIGPSIGSCHFEVDAEVAVVFSDAYKRKVGDKYHIDLWSMILKQLTNAGVKDGNITLAGVCTYCNSGEFFSHRADNGKTGSLAALMEIR